MLSILLLWPFDFHMPFSKNDVRWIEGMNGIEFVGPGSIQFSSFANALHSALLSGNGLTVEVWAATRTNDQEGPARIVSYSKNSRLRNFSLGQARGDLVMRMRTSESDVNGTDRVLIGKGLFRPNEPQHVTVTYDFSQQQVYVDGDMRLRTTMPWGRFTTWDPSYSFVVGNEATGNRPWLGKLFLLAVYNRALSDDEIRRNYAAGRLFASQSNGAGQRVERGLLAHYIFTEGKGKQVFNRGGELPSADLDIPALIETSGRSYLTSPYAEFRSESLTFRRAIDIIGNILVFIPLGLLLYEALSGCRRSPRQGIAWALAAGILFTIAMESLQYFSQTRYSSMTDVIANAIGTILGVSIDTRAAWRQ
jgi:VanZ family protein